MRAGSLRIWLVFENLTETQDSDGNLIETWVDAFPYGTSMPCRVEPMTGRELLAAGAVQSSATIKITTRYRPGFTPKMRATDVDGRVYNIEAVLQDKVSGIREITLAASTGINAGGTPT